MAINKKLIFWNNQSNFSPPTSSTDTTKSVLWQSIVFFNDTKKIWTHGVYFSSPLDTLLSGYSVGTDTALAASDTILGAFGKIQAQLNAKQVSLPDIPDLAGTYTKVTVSAKGLVTAGSNPTTLAGYGITDAYTKTQINGFLYTDTRTITPTTWGPGSMQFGFTSKTLNNVGNWADFIRFGGYMDSTGGRENIILFFKDGFGLRQYQGDFDSESYNHGYVDYWHSGNFNPANYALLAGSTSQAFNTASLLVNNDLTINGANLRLDGSTDKTIRLYSATHWYYHIKTASDDFYISDAQGYEYLRFYYNGGTKYTKIGNVSITGGALSGATSFNSILTVNQGRGASHFELTGTDADYGVARIYHTSTAGSGTPGVYTATLALIDQRINNLSGPYEPNFYINVTGLQTIVDLIRADVRGTTVFRLSQSGAATFSSTVSATGFTENGTALASKYLGISANANSASRLRSIGYATSMDLNTYLAGGGIVGNYGGSGYWINGPSGMSYGSVIQFDPAQSSSILSLQLAFDVNHNSTSSTKSLWFRTSNNLGFQNDWKEIIHSGSIGSQSVNYALNSTRLYASDAPYTWGSSSAYYMYMNYDGGSYWELKVSPATPGSVRVAYANNAGTSSYTNNINTGASIQGGAGWSYLRFQTNNSLWDIGKYDSQGNDLQFRWGGGETKITMSPNATLYSYALRGNSNVAGTGEAIYCPAGVYSTGTNWLYGTMYLNVNSINDAADIRLYNSGYHFRARYSAGSDIYHASLNWYGLQLGNNGDNYIVGGRTNIGGNLKFYVNNTSDFPTINGTLALTLNANATATFSSNVTAPNFLGNLSGYAIQSHRYHSSRDFGSGTLIQTSIWYGSSEGDPFILEIKGNSYGGIIPFDIQYQGYIYANTIINHGGVSVGTNISGLVAINYNGYLCFWFPRQSYWQGFNVFVYTAYGTYAVNRVTSISDSGKPTTAKEVSLVPTQVSYNGHTHNYLPLTGGTVTGRITLQNGDDSGTYYGPNSSWGAYLYVGASGNRTNSNTAQAISTDGNLHLDSASGKAMYLNYYNNTLIRAYGELTMNGYNISSVNLLSATTLGGNIYIGGNSAYNILSNAWAGAGGYPGYQYNGGYSRFGFSSTGGIVDVFADGNFYATDNAYLVLHTGNYSSYALPLSGGALSGALRISANSNLYLDYNYGQSIVGVYASTRYQGIFAMGDSYKLPIDGTSTGNLYGLAWSHPNAGGVASNLNTHGLLVMENGTFLAAISGSIRARDDVRAPALYDSGSRVAISRGDGRNYVDYAYGLYDAYRGGWRTSNDLYVAYAYSAGNAATADKLNGYGSNPNNSHPGHGLRAFYSWSAGQAYNDSSGYSNGITIGSHSSDPNYGFQIVQNMWDDRLYFRRYDYGWKSWLTVIDSATIGSQSVNYASTSGNADSVDGQHFVWSNTSNGPSYLWGANSNGTSFLVERGSMSVNYANYANYANYLPTHYAGGQQTNPQVYFNNGIGLKEAMTGAWSVWSDTLWINGYSGGDVPWMCALHFLRNSEPRMAISAQTHTSTSYGTFYEVITAYNIASQSVSYATSAGSASSATNASYASNAGKLNNFTYDQFAFRNGGTGYYYIYDWIQLNGVYGLYCPGTNSAHFLANTSSSYGTWRIAGSRGGYSGFYDTYSTVNIGMLDANGNGGMYREAQGRWYFYYNLSNACMSINTSTTSSSYGMYVSGGIYSTGNIVGYSDIRKKENIITVENALDKVLKLRGVFYNRKDDNSKTRQLGVIAQEVQEVLPEVVTYAYDIDEYGVSYGNFAGLFIQAIKEQQLIIEKQANEIENLKQLISK